MVELLAEELHKRLEIEDMKTINREVTNAMQQEEKFILFHKWLKENNVRYDSIEYPVAFGKSGDLVGLAAKRKIGPGEAYIFIPNHMIINDEKILKSEIGFIIKKHPEVFETHADGEYLRLIFFITYELTKGEKSFWNPYFQIAHPTDLPCFWEESDLDILEDPLLKAEIKEYKIEYDEEYKALCTVAKLYPDVINFEEFTEDKFKLAFTTVVTRCFGWSLPSTSVIPFADCANHFIIDNQYELFNKRLHEKKLNDENLNSQELTYFTMDKMRINYKKHFDEKYEDDGEGMLAYKTRRYIKKLAMRNECEQIKPDQFLNDPKYKDMQVWDLKYISTSDEEDNDTSESEDDEDDDEEESEDESGEEDSNESSEEEKSSEKKQKSDKKSRSAKKEEKDLKKVFKEDEEHGGKGEKIPDVAKKLRPGKKKQRVYYAYTYENEKATSPEEMGIGNQKQMVVRKRVEKRSPEDLIDILIKQKSYLYESEQRMKLLKEQDEEEWSKMTEEYNSSEEEDDEENFGWFKDEDKDTYFVLATKYKNVYEVGDQVFHCYGRRTNRFLLCNYGFCLNNNKYNSLSFRVWINFNWEEEKQKEALRQEQEKKGEKPQEDDNTNRISKVIRIKQNRLSEEIFGYLRANLLNTYKGKNLEHLLISSPVDPEFEMLVIACTINLLKGLLASRFKSPLEQDYKELEEPNISFRKRCALLHRKNAKEILKQNINYCDILMRILARFNDGKEFKRAYMQIVSDFETEETLMKNRIIMRRYLRELLVNQKRVLDVAKDEKQMSQIQKMLELKKKYQEKKDEMEKLEMQMKEMEKEAIQEKKQLEEGKDQKENVNVNSQPKIVDLTDQ